MKYRLLKDMPEIGSKGDTFHWDYLVLLLRTKLLEEVKEGKIELWEEIPPKGTDYWFIDHSDYDSIFVNIEDYADRPVDRFLLKYKNMHKTRESAEEALRLIRES